MSGLLTFLILGALFFFMMRFGCGSHVGHGGHEGGVGGGGPVGPGQQMLAAAVDPVCGMKVDADMGYIKMFRGKPYRLCSRECLDKFEAEPDRYLGAASGPPAQPGSGPGRSAS